MAARQRQAVAANGDIQDGKRRRHRGMEPGRPEAYEVLQELSMATTLIAHGQTETASGDAHPRPMEVAAVEAARGGSYSGWVEVARQRRRWAQGPRTEQTGAARPPAPRLRKEGREELGPGERTKGRRKKKKQEEEEEGMKKKEGEKKGKDGMWSTIVKELLYYVYVTNSSR
ncbi:hypothetical protein E2562_001503 [Oryza meyeriana var. granulata]|uniref:Uncharacterized protein n=1 Tax=Oryza meyeriana var. granulata TaxID=110450 RepID=A0A6G1DF24_9ORYZ|nr:hypothetical protein E2562_001503 [Oryza meyeriana var. granulata]